MRTHRLVLIVSMLWIPVVPDGRNSNQRSVDAQPRFEKIADGVYYATSTGSMSVGANSCIVVNDKDVFVLDPGESPATARALVEDIKTITDTRSGSSPTRTFTSIIPTGIRFSARRLW